MIQNLETAAPGNDISSKRTKKFDEIVLLKGLAIICIVVGHASNAFNGIGWTSVLAGDYVPVMASIFLYIGSFDLLLSCAISGYLYAIYSKQELNVNAY